VSTKCWSTMLQTKPPPATQKWFVPRPCDQHHVMSFSLWRPFQTHHGDSPISFFNIWCRKAYCQRPYY